jgi:hypothetical protein
MKTDFASRLRWGFLVGLLIAGGIVVKDVVLGQWDELGPVKFATLVVTVLISAFAYAWLSGRFGRNDDA